MRMQELETFSGKGQRANILSSSGGLCWNNLASHTAKQPQTIHKPTGVAGISLNFISRNGWWARFGPWAAVCQFLILKVYTTRLINLVSSPKTNPTNCRTQSFQRSTEYFQNLTTCWATERVSTNAKTQAPIRAYSLTKTHGHLKKGHKKIFGKVLICLEIQNSYQQSKINQFGIRKSIERNSNKKT